MGKKKDKKYEFDFEEEYGGTVGFDDTPSFGNITPFGADNESPFGPLDTTKYTYTPMVPLCENTFESQRLQMIKSRLAFGKGFNLKEKKKAKKRLVSGDFSLYEYVVLKNGETLKKKEEKLLKKINIIRILKGLPVVKVIEHEIENEYFNDIKKKYKIYDCKRFDTRLLELNNSDFLEYISKHDVKELFISREESIFIDYDYIKERTYIESVDNDIDTYIKLLNKLDKSITTYYNIIYCMNGINIMTKVKTGNAAYASYEDEIYEWYRDEITGEVL